MHMLGWYDEGLRMLEKFRALFPEETEFSNKMSLELEKASALSSEQCMCVLHGIVLLCIRVCVGLMYVYLYKCMYRYMYVQPIQPI